ncbi:MAG: phosphoenolpyruvate--protein phosphotransferase, partial [Gammaproteobacteria bacterium]|nr:phosphoenolpyruvate--protein phosphotransferase [Gammaproteobacteria bacterium]
HFFPEADEESYFSYMGVPIIHHRSVLGVLVVQRYSNERFSEDEETFLITVAAQLASAIIHAQAVGDVALPSTDRASTEEHRRLKGLPGAPGVAMGTAVVVYPMADLDAVPDRLSKDIEQDITEFQQAVSAVKSDIASLSKRLGSVLPEEELALFDAYRLMLDSGSFTRQIEERIQEGQWSASALRDVIKEHVKVFKAMEDPYLSERSDDVRDLGQRILSYLQQEQREKLDYPADTILVGDDITASMLAEVPTEVLAGVVSSKGSRSSHVAILARALDIPAVMGATELPVGRVDGRELIADGYSGRVYINPGKAIRKEFQRLIDEERDLHAGLVELRDLPAETTDGQRIHLYANTGLLTDISPTLKSGAEGVGLYRTEFPFMIRERFPGEEEQRQIYRTVLEAFNPMPVVLRTLDVGGDKALPYFPIKEENPFLGWRGIRITLDHPEIFLVQLRAMLRASEGLENLHLLLPMISNVAEVDQSMALIRRACAELKEEGYQFPQPRVGAMIEVPSAVYQMSSLAKRVDFFSVGSNDLTQYLLAVDRNNAQVAELYDSLHPAVLSALLMVMDGAGKFDKPVSICGEMAGDPAAVLLLMGMGVDSFSMSASSLPRVKWVIRNFSQTDAKELLNQALEMEDAVSIRQYLNNALETAGLGGLIRAGK